MLSWLYLPFFGHFIHAGANSSCPFAREAKMQLNHLLKSQNGGMQFFTGGQMEDAHQMLIIKAFAQLCTNADTGSFH